MSWWSLAFILSALIQMGLAWPMNGGDVVAQQLSQGLESEEPKPIHRKTFCSLKFFTMPLIKFGLFTLRNNHKS